MSSSLAVKQQMIIEYWYRIILNLNYSIDNIWKIITEFAKEYERFDTKFCYKGLIIESEGLIIGKISTNRSEAQSGFGSIIAKSGLKYHWKIKYIKGKSLTDINLGIIEYNKYKENLRDMWWNKKYGFSYYCKSGLIYNLESKKYGDKYTIGDIIDIWVDLKDEYQL